MGDAGTLLSVNDVKHVLRRTGFGAHPKELKKLLRQMGTNPNRSVLVTRLLAEKELLYQLETGTDIRGFAVNKWMQDLTKTKSPLRSKLVLFFHDHFATQTSIANDFFMGIQILRFHRHAMANFRTLVKEMHRDAALMEMLDTPMNTKFTPNENYGRELLELFTLGEKDLAGNPNYTQSDVIQIARAFTGWRHEGPNDSAILRYDLHDFDVEHPERGPKVVFQSTGGFGPQGRNLKATGEGPQEIDRVTDALFAHRDSDGKSTIARRLTRKLLRFFCHEAYATPGAAEIAVIDQIIAQSGFDTTWELLPLYRAIFTHDVFYETAAPASGGVATRKAVKWPIDYLVTTLRLTGVPLRTRLRIIAGGSNYDPYTHLTLMGQLPLEPPSVFGWEWDTPWFASAMLLSRYRFARDVIAARGSFRPQKLMDTKLTDPVRIVDAVTASLGIDDLVSTDERQIFIDYLTDNGASTTIDLKNQDVRNVKLHGLYGLVMQSPAFQLH